MADDRANSLRDERRNLGYSKEDEYFFLADNELIRQRHAELERRRAARRVAKEPVAESEVPRLPRRDSSWRGLWKRLAKRLSKLAKVDKDWAP